MKDRTSKQLIHACVILAILSCLSSIGKLTWVECIRLLVILIVLALLVVRHGRSVIGGRPLPGASAILALGLAFTVTQFDPAMSGIAQQQPLPRLSLVSVVTTLLGIIAGLTAILALGSSLKWTCLSLLDKVVLLVVAGVVILTIVSRNLVGASATWEDALVVLRLISFAGWWISITRAYGDVSWPESHPILGRWLGPLVVALVVILPTVVYGGYRLSAVIYHVAQGQDAFKAGQWNQVKEHFETASALNVTVDLAGAREGYLADPAVLQKIGDVYLSEESWSDAAAAYERVLEEGPNWVVQDALGLAYLRLGDKRSFLELARRLNHLPLAAAKAYDDLMFVGDVQFSLEHYGSAHDFYVAAAELRPEDAHARFKVGRAWFEQGDAEHAIRQFHGAIKLDPGFADAYYYIGSCMAAMGDTVAAISWYEQTVDLVPDHPAARKAVKRLR
jgi:tetratricopeptide (TPR) repeat protein